MLVAAGLIVGVLLVAEGVASGGVEAHGYVARILLAQNIVQRVAEAEYGRGVETTGGEAWGAEQGLVRSVNQGEGIQKE